MNIARVLMVGAHRIGSACLSLQFDRNLTKFDKTYVVCPLPGDRLQTTFEKYNIDTQGFEYVNDYDLVKEFPLIANWYLTGEYRGSWLTQQAMKFYMLDKIDADVVFIHDADSFCVEPYECVVDDKLNLFYLPETTHAWEYYRAFENVTGLPRQSEDCYIAEMMPVFKHDWNNLKTLIAGKFDQPWSDVLIEQTPWDYVGNIKWFSEYEFLGNWIISQHSNYIRTQQHRYDYKKLEDLTHQDFPTDVNCVSDKNPFGNILPFDYGTDTVMNLHTVLDRFQRIGILPD